MILNSVDLIQQKDRIKKIFFYRICGTGMGAAACLLKEAGFQVEGGDRLFNPPMSTYLQDLDIDLHKLSDMTPEFLRTFDLIVVGNVVPKGSDDAKLIESLDVPITSFPSAMGGLVLKGRKTVGLSGTHGKTTSTYFATQMFENLGQKPGYFIGGVLEGKNSSAIGTSDYFFLEADEYDCSYFDKVSKFLRYELHNLVITSIEFDHADIFSSVEDIKDQFRPLLEEVEGTVIACSDYPETVSLLKSLNKKVHYYGDDSTGIGPHIIETNSDGTVFELILNNEKVKFETDVIGVHNIKNITSLIIFAHSEGFKVNEIKDSVRSLSLVKRRQEIIGWYNGSPIIDDFAHHPRAVEATLQAISQKYPGKELNVLFEPHSATARSNIFQKEFQQAFMSADSIAITKLNRSTTVKEAGNLDIEALVGAFKKEDLKAETLGDLDSIVRWIETHCSEKSIILVLSNGTCLGLWESTFVKNLKK
jgi:UDP-N-acetylmuramate: L-alanyl-gamma-D-glutamyl-meso-diaminopimelate ligase